MKIYIEAFYADGTQKLGNLDGQAVIRVPNWRRTAAYRHLFDPLRPRYPAVHHWKVVSGGTVLARIPNPEYRA